MSALLEVRDLQVAYGHIEAVQGISFEVNSGEIRTLVGANGAGKSTTLLALSGLLLKLFLFDTAHPERAQREALERADLALRKLAAQAHGETLTQLMTAWETRDATHMPSLQDLGRGVSPAVRGAWVQALELPLLVAVLKPCCAWRRPSPAPRRSGS